MKKNRKRKKKRNARNTARRSLKTLLPFLPFIAPVVATAFIYMWIYTSMNITAMPITELRKTRKELIKHNDSTRLRISELEASGRIESIAREKLGMISPEDYRVVALDESMLPPGDAGAGPRPAAKRLQVKERSEGLFGFLKIGSRGSLNERGKVDGVPQEVAFGQAVRQPG